VQSGTANMKRGKKMRGQRTNPEALFNKLRELTGLLDSARGQLVELVRSVAEELGTANHNATMAFHDLQRVLGYVSGLKGFAPNMTEAFSGQLDYLVCTAEVQLSEKKQTLDAVVVEATKLCSRLRELVAAGNKETQPSAGTMLDDLTRSLSGVN